MRTWVLGVALVVGLVAGATPALADTMYWVEVEWTSGLLNGQTDIGSGTYDESVLTGVGNEEIGPDGGTTFTDADLTVAITVGGVSHTEMDDQQYPNYPFLTFTNGVLTGNDYVLREAGTKLILFMDLAQFYDAAGNLVSEGTVAISFTNPNPIPEPASLALFGLGAVGLGVYRRRRRG